MSLFKKKRSDKYVAADSAALAQRALDFITEGVMLVDESGMIQFANPAAAAMAGYNGPDNITGLDYQLVMHLESSEGTPIEIAQSDVYTALMTNQAMTTREYLLVSAQTEHKIAVALSCIPTGGQHDFKIITFRDITKELAEENEQAEFISTASHEMRTPVASIEGYLGLALNPQTATIDVRAKQYLEAAHTASQHLGHLFKDLLDVTKLDDNRIKPRLVPVDAVEVVQKITSEHLDAMQEKKLRFSFGTVNPVVLDKKHIDPKVYMATDLDFLREVLDNLIGNAIKYTPEGGEIWVNCRGDGDKVLINVTDTGIGISSEDAGHIFQKFYRVDNSQTRQIGGTGLGLYLVKQRVEALGGRVWVESAFGDGSTFFVSLPRLSESEYEKMRIAQNNEQMIRNFSAPKNILPNGAPLPGGRPVAGVQTQQNAAVQSAPVQSSAVQATSTAPNTLTITMHQNTQSAPTLGTQSAPIINIQSMPNIPVAANLAGQNNPTANVQTKQNGSIVGTASQSVTSSAIQNAPQPVAQNATSLATSAQAQSSQATQSIQPASNIAMSQPAQNPNISTKEVS